MYVYAPIFISLRDDAIFNGILEKQDIDVKVTQR